LIHSVTSPAITNQLLNFIKDYCILCRSSEVLVNIPRYWLSIKGVFGGSKNHIKQLIVKSTLIYKMKIVIVVLALVAGKLTTNVAY